MKPSNYTDHSVSAPPVRPSSLAFVHSLPRSSFAMLLAAVPRINTIVALTPPVKSDIRHHHHPCQSRHISPAIHNPQHVTRAHFDITPPARQDPALIRAVPCVVAFLMISPVRSAFLYASELRASLAYRGSASHRLHVYLLPAQPCSTAPLKCTCRRLSDVPCPVPARTESRGNSVVPSGWVLAVPSQSVPGKTH
jgi:hypothetical protein